MARRRFLVAVLPPGEVIATTRHLRHLLGDHRPERIVPHITLVPPTNIEVGGFASLRRHLRSVTSTAHRPTLFVEGIASFRPSTPTLHFAVAEQGSDILDRLRSSLMTGVLHRLDDREFRPHITIRSRMGSADLDHALAALSAGRPSGGIPSGGRPSGGMPSPGRPSPDSDEQAPTAGTVFAPWRVESVLLMEQFRSDERGTYWTPIVEEALGEPVVVGRGGIELVIRQSSLVEVGARVLLDEFDVGRSGESCGGSGDRSGTVGTRTHVLTGADVFASTQRTVAGDLLVVTAEFPNKVGQPVGVAVGRVCGDAAELSAVVVQHDSRNLGVGRQVLSHWCHAAATRGASMVWSTDQDGSGVLGAVGFVRVGNRWVREMD